MEEKRKELKVSAIKDGTVIDHIQAKNLFKVIAILDLVKIDSQITFGTNFESKKLGKKGVIKIAEKFPGPDDLNKIAIIAPEAKINIIRNYKVTEKYSVEVPDKVSSIIKCMNPKCITNNDNVKTEFTVLKKNGEILLRCHYCEKNTNL